MYHGFDIPLGLGQGKQIHRLQMSVSSRSTVRKMLIRRVFHGALNASRIQKRLLRFIRFLIVQHWLHDLLLP
ncbi:MAG: hypothetical protein TH68_02145 [Candidatus Synechococcus spongiarum 142]|uniref:Uncharacterized protein n=1 Tax=Candidatus Synechococcus spongiarum 142 TaxID=1608213 RepID=A0A6N3X6B1_9SYNE|nr:MAG: hypothetical protein TH68_02145 [Candidatus Synechococcus spongiarum 142]